MRLTHLQSNFFSIGSVAYIGGTDSRDSGGVDSTGEEGGGLEFSASMGQEWLGGAEKEPFLAIRPKSGESSGDKRGSSE
jgi:hypothetical protein